MRWLATTIVKHTITPVKRHCALCVCCTQATWRAGYWVGSMGYACFHGQHLAVALGLGLPTILLLGLGIPLLVGGMVGRHRHELDTAPCRRRLGFAYRSYQ